MTMAVRLKACGERRAQNPLLPYVMVGCREARLTVVVDGESTFVVGNRKYLCHYRMLLILLLFMLILAPPLG